MFTIKNLIEMETYSIGLKYIFWWKWTAMSNFKKLLAVTIMEEYLILVSA